MKTIALGTLLFCGLAAVLGYVATNGVGMRTTGFGSDVTDNIPIPPQKSVRPVPEVQIDARPMAADQPAKATPVPKPVRRATSVHPHPRHPVAVRPKNSMVRPESEQDWAKHVVAMSSVASKNSSEKPIAATPPARPIHTRSLSFTVRPLPPRDESQDMQRQMEADREWREKTLERWREEEKGAGTRQRTGAATTDRSLDSTTAGGLYKAEDDKKPKRKRHRFLFIRWG